MKMKKTAEDEKRSHMTFGGYIAFWIFQLTQPLRNKNGWDFFILIFGISISMNICQKR